MLLWYLLLINSSKPPPPSISVWYAWDTNPCLSKDVFIQIKQTVPLYEKVSNFNYISPYKILDLIWQGYIIPTLVIYSFPQVFSVFRDCEQRSSQINLLEVILASSSLLYKACSVTTMCSLMQVHVLGFIDLTRETEEMGLLNDCYTSITDS